MDVVAVEKGPTQRLSWQLSNACLSKRLLERIIVIPEAYYCGYSIKAERTLSSAVELITLRGVQSPEEPQHHAQIRRTIEPLGLTS